MPDNGNKPIDDAVARALLKIHGEMPDVNPTVTPSTGSILTRFLMPRGSLAVTNPFTGNITYNPEAMQGMNQNEIENTLTHEMTHSRQAQTTPFYQVLFNALKQGLGMGYSYNQRPEEMEAFQAERNRTLAQHLPWMRDPQSGMGDYILPPGAK